MLEKKCHKARYEVCYGDTDAGGVVYYANYLKFAEAARSQLMRDSGLSLWQLQTEEKIGFVVRECLLTIKESLRLDDSYVVISQTQNISRTSIEFIQLICRADTERLAAQVICKMTCVGESFKPVRIPESYLNVIKEISAE